MKKFIKPILYSLGILFIGVFIITLFNYIGLINGIFLVIIKFMIPVLAFFISGFMIGKCSNEKGWLSGIKIGFVLAFILSILSLVFKINLNIILILYYLALVVICAIGGIIGINRKNDK